MITNSNFKTNQASMNEFFAQINNNVFSLIYVNIRSLRKNFNNFLAEFMLIESKIDFIVFSEIWIGSDELDLYGIPGYNIYAKCNDNYRSGGVICYAHHDIFVSQLDVDMLSADCLVLNVKISNNNFKLMILYRFNFSPENDFITELGNYLSACNQNIIYLGDININLLESTSVAQHYFNLLNDHSFFSLIDAPTRITVNSKSLIDHIFIRNPKIDCFKAAVFDIGLTDHCVLGLKMYSLKKNNYVGDTAVTSSPINEKVVIDFDLLQQKLCNTDWSDCYHVSDVNACYDRFIEILSSNIEACGKTIKISKLDKARVITPWMNPNLLNRITRRKKLYTSLKKRPYDLNFKKYFQTFCNKLKTDIDQVKKDYYSRKIYECGNDSAQCWKIINKLSGAPRSKHVDRVELDNGEVLSDACEVAETINSYLIAAQGHYSASTCSSYQQPSSQLNPHSFFITPTTENEIIQVVKNLKNKKSSGIDNFTVSCIKYISREIAPVLTHIINLSFEHGIFPEKLKICSVVPIYKKVSSIKLDNIRPISLVSVFSKILEKIMKTRLINFLDRLKFHSNFQFGFMKGKSTEEAILSVTDRIYSSMNSKEKATGLFIDFKKAFDLVDHSVLLTKLERTGVRGNALKWFSSFLNNRTQQVKVSNILSSPLIVKAGVPQGSVISANLFLVFINDLLQLPFHGQISAFADDIALFYSYTDSFNAWQMISEDLNTIRNWCFINKMQVNVSKTKYVNFSHNSFDLPLNVVYHINDCYQDHSDCQTIERVKAFKYLGVMLDEQLNWEKHISDVHSKIRKTVRKFYYLRNYCNEFTLKTLYYAFVHSRLQYALHCWGGAYKSYIDKLRTTQNHIIRIIANRKIRDSAFPLYFQLKILPIKHLYVYKVLRIFFHKSGNLGTTNLFHYTRSNSNRLFKLPKIVKSMFKQSYQYSAPKYFNKLPLGIKNCNNFKEFSSKLWDWLLKQSSLDFLDFSMM